MLETACMCTNEPCAIMIMGGLTRNDPSLLIMTVACRCQQVGGIVFQGLVELIIHGKHEA